MSGGGVPVRFRESGVAMSRLSLSKWLSPAEPDRAAVRAWARLSTAGAAGRYGGASRQRPDTGAATEREELSARCVIWSDGRRLSILGRRQRQPRSCSWAIRAEAQRLQAAARAPGRGCQSPCVLRPPDTRRRRRRRASTAGPRQPVAPNAPDNSRHGRTAQRASARESAPTTSLSARWQFREETSRRPKTDEAILPADTGKVD